MLFRVKACETLASLGFGAVIPILRGLIRETADVKSIKVFGRRVRVPGNIILRVGLGVLCILGGIFSFLPILGVWMLPLGLMILSIDFPPIRRFRRVATVKLVGWLKRRWPALAVRLGLGVNAKP
jgi:hypothetical protein